MMNQPSSVARSESVFGYPRPQLQRKDAKLLNGAWDFSIDADGHWLLPEEVHWQRQINVPFAPETPASGVGETGFFRACWYRCSFDRPRLHHGQRLLLHFGAVDYIARVWVNGQFCMEHEGGYTPFSADITSYLSSEGPQTIVVRADDDPHNLAKPRGKQDWRLDPHWIWYYRTTGIWQTVWLERVPQVRIGFLRWTPNVDRWEIGFEARVDGLRQEGVHLRVTLHAGDVLIAEDVYAVVAGEVHRRIALSDPGVDDYRNELLWSPMRPTLLHATIDLLDDRGNRIDSVHSYTALRSIGVQGDKFVLNGRPYPLRMVLDQGYWPEGGLTAPSDDALRRDVELTKAMGFNGVRKHQKIENPRYLYWADALGLLVWEEMPSAYRFTKQSIERLAREWTAVIERDFSHPCIVAWVPFNESWGVPNLPDNPAQRHYVQALYHLTKTLDPSRPVVGNDGWESVATDIIGIHDYDDQPQRIAQRYSAHEELPRLFKRERPAGRLLVLGTAPPADQPIVLTEFGGIAFSKDSEHTWGHSEVETPEKLRDMYAELIEVVRKLPVLAGFCYTQLADTYQEANGLLYADRTPKFPLDEIAHVTRGPRTARDRQLEWEWRERLMNSLHNRLVPINDHWE